MTGTTELDTRDFESALKEYYRATGKDAAYVVNRSALNVAIKAAQNTPVANAASVQALTQKPWWPKYVAKKISSKGGVVLKNKRLKGRRYLQGHYTIREAKLASKQLLRNKLKRRGYIRSGWLPAVQTLSELKLKMRGQIAGVNSQKRWGGRRAGGVVVAVPGINPVAELINDARGAAKVAGPALQKAFGLAAEDMREYIRDKYGETAKEFNGNKR